MIAAHARRWRHERGQTATEYLMLLGLMTAIIIEVTKIVVPALMTTVLGLARHMSVYLSSVNR